MAGDCTPTADTGCGADKVDDDGRAAGAKGGAGSGDMGSPASKKEAGGGGSAAIGSTIETGATKGRGARDAGGEMPRKPCGGGGSSGETEPWPGVLASTGPKPLGGAMGSKRSAEESCECEGGGGTAGRSGTAEATGTTPTETEDTPRCITGG